MTDAQRLAAALRRDFSGLPPSRDPAWSRAPAVRLIDCILSLRRPDDRPIAPALDAFERRFPAVESVQQLRALIGSYKSPALFAKDALESSDPARAQMLKSLIEYLVRAAFASPGP